MRTTGRGLWSIAAALIVAAGLSGCSGQAEPEPTPTVEPAVVSELGPVLSKLAFGNADAGDDGGSCLVNAVREAGVTPEAEQVLLEVTGTSWSDAAKAVTTELSADQGEILVSRSLRHEIDVCAMNAFHVDAEAKEIAGLPVEPVVHEKDAEQNTEPTVTVDPQDLRISPDKIKPGLVAMLSSYESAEQEGLIASHASCLTDAVVRAGFSSEALEFIGSGPKLGSGSVAQALPTEADQQLWASASFTVSLSGCLDGPAETEEG